MLKSMLATEDKTLVAVENKNSLTLMLQKERYYGFLPVVLMDSGTTTSCVPDQCSKPSTEGHELPNSCHCLTSSPEISREKYFPPSPGRLFLLEGTSSLRSIKVEKKTSRKIKEPGINRQRPQAPLRTAHI